MRALSTRPRRLAVGIAVLSAAALGTVSASAAQSSHPHPSGTHPGKGGSALVVSYEPTADAPDDVNAVNDDFAACMREHGEPSVPVFHAAKDANGRISLEVNANGTAPTPRTFQKALKSCAPILKKVGITLSTNTDTPPPLPKPDGPGEMGGTTST